MKLSESKLKSIIREEYYNLILEGPGKTSGTAEEKGKYRKPKPKELRNYNESVSKAEDVVRQEIVKEFKREKADLLSKLTEKHKLEELRSFREDAMRAYLDKYPVMNAVFERSGKDLKTFWDTHVRNNARNERRYSHSL